MGSHPINLAFRFFLEIVALLAMGYWGWTQHDGVMRFVWALGLPLLSAVVWGTFAVPDDPSRSGKAPVPVPGVIRLILELIVFTLGAWCLYDSGLDVWGLVFGLAVIIHYALSYDRVLWLVKR
jgi:hypothetical protein